MYRQNVEGRQFTKDIVLPFDTITIKDVVILPWKTYEEFKRDMLTEEPVKPEIKNMYDNLAALQQSILNIFRVQNYLRSRLQICYATECHMR